MLGNAGDKVTPPVQASSNDALQTTRNATSTEEELLALLQKRQVEIKERLEQFASQTSHLAQLSETFQPEYNGLPFYICTSDNKPTAKTEMTAPNLNRITPRTI